MHAYQMRVGERGVVRDALVSIEGYKVVYTGMRRTSASVGEGSYLISTIWVVQSPSTGRYLWNIHEHNIS